MYMWNCPHTHQPYRVGLLIILYNGLDKGLENCQHINVGTNSKQITRIIDIKDIILQ